MGDIKTEVDYIFDKKMECPVCGKDFFTKQIRTGKVRFVGTDDILKPIYNNIDCTKYDVIMCPHCGYASGSRNYGHITPKQRQSVRDNIESKFKANIPESEIYSYDAAIRRCKMAMLTEMVTHGKLSESAYLCLRLSWLYEGEIDDLEQNADVDINKINKLKESEQEYIQSAYNGMKKALETEYPPICGMDEKTINYLMASLAVRCKNYDEAKQFATAIIGSRTAPSSLKEKTRELIAQIKEEQKTQ